MKSLCKLSLVVFLFITGFGCKTDVQKTDSQKRTPGKLEEAALQLQNYEGLKHSKIMILGTLHFRDDILETENQEGITKLIEALSTYAPTKVVVEWEPSRHAATNRAYRDYLAGSFDISNRSNEVYQLGFRLAQYMGHDSIYLFDNQTEYIGSLENFSFDAFTTYAKQNDSGFYDRYEQSLIETFDNNQDILNGHALYDRIAIMNSPAAQKINANRMHMYEIRVGIQKNWLGPDWLSRVYQRNVRMASNVLKMAESGDRILVIVGDNHKWTLDMLFENIPDFELVSSWEHLK